MPATTFIAREQVINNRRGRPRTDSASEMANWAVEAVNTALIQGQAISAILTPEERYSTAVNALKAAAKSLSNPTEGVTITVSFRNGESRPHGKGKEVYQFQGVVTRTTVPVAAPVTEEVEATEEVPAAS